MTQGAGAELTSQSPPCPGTQQLHGTHRRALIHCPDFPLNPSRISGEQGIARIQSTTRVVQLFEKVLDMGHGHQAGG
jgi:hypothetical protein